MPMPTIYTQIRDLLKRHLKENVAESTLERITLLVVGMMKAESASPARIARALHQLGLSPAEIPSIERRLRRIENDPHLTATLWLHPFARERLLLGRPRELLASDMPPQWSLLRLYQRRYPVEATFRDYKSHGWHWEDRQVKDLAHRERLLVGIALATWLALLVGTQVANEILHRPMTGRRRTLPWAGKWSLFQLGLDRIRCMLHGSWTGRLVWQLSDWEALHWQAQLKAHYVRAWIFTCTAA